MAVGLPFGLLDAEEVGRALPFSRLADCIEFWRARVGAGIGATIGTGDGWTATGFGSGSSVSTGDEVADGGKGVTPFLLKIIVLDTCP